MTNPDPVQREAALQRANEVRLAVAAVKRQVHNGEMTLGEAMGESCVASMTVFRLLCAQKQWAAARASRLLWELDINAYKTIAELTPRQRALVAEATKGGKT